MMYKYLLSICFSVALLSACSVVEVFKPVPYDEPQSGELAYIRLRGATNNTRIYPEQNCIPYGWQNKLARVVTRVPEFNGSISSLNTVRDLNLPKPPKGLGKAKRDFVEFKVKAGQPFTFNTDFYNNGSLSCYIAQTFVPKAGEYYELTHRGSYIQGHKAYCSLTLERFGIDGNGQYFSIPLNAKPAVSCPKN